MLKAMLIPLLVLCTLIFGCGANPAGQQAEAGPAPVSQARDFPFEQSLAHENTFAPTGALEKISENLYRYEDCANVYIVKSGAAALLVDFGTGDVQKRLAEIGVETVEEVLLTHHHRDQAQGLADLDKYDFNVTVPAAEALYFEDVENFWDKVKIHINYNCRSHWNTIRHSIRVDRKVAGGDSFDWRGITFKVVHCPGSSVGAVTYVAEIDGKTVAFSGDLISGSGKVTNWFDLHWSYYGFTQGINASEKSFERVMEHQPQVLLPSHGAPIDDPAAAIAANNGIYDQIRQMLPPNELHRQKHEVREITPHLAYIGMNCYGLVSKSGKAFLWDYGYVERSMVGEFKRRFNVDRIDAVSFSHYHDDHNIRAYELGRTDSTEIWIYENMLEVFEHPERFKLPCLIPFPIKADRVLHDREKIQWEEYTLEFFHQPGQTEYHQAMVVEVDGQKVMFTGDNTWNKAEVDKVRNGPVVPHNVYFLDGGFIKCAERMLEYAPDMVCPAHTEEYYPTREDLEGFLGWAKNVRTVMTGLIDQPDPNFGMDYNWCRFHPFRSQPEYGENIAVDVMLRNHLFTDAEVKVELKLPEGLTCAHPVRTLTMSAKKQVAVPFVLKAATGVSGRKVVTADITINGRRIGEYAEMLVDL
jgi:glyoxylase-like metal-dependent hydrolase (beta-lactamase superfamily II)